MHINIVYHMHRLASSYIFCDENIATLLKVAKQRRITTSSQSARPLKNCLNTIYFLGERIISHGLNVKLQLFA